MNKKSFHEAKITENGHKLTRQRRLILEIFQESDGWINAKDLLQQVLAKNKKINFSTVYRNLETLTEIGILCKVTKDRGVNYYTLNHQEDRHHHIVCITCGRIKKVDFCPLKEIKDQIIEDFTIVDHKLEIYGYCKECKGIF